MPRKTDTGVARHQAADIRVGKHHFTCPHGTYLVLNYHLAKRTVELAIETDEQTAMDYINQQSGEC